MSVLQGILSKLENPYTLRPPCSQNAIVKHCLAYSSSHNKPPRMVFFSTNFILNFITAIGIRKARRYLRSVQCYINVLPSYCYKFTNRRNGHSIITCWSRWRKDHLIILRFQSCQNIRAKTLIIVGQIWCPWALHTHVIPVARVVLANGFQVTGAGLERNRNTFSHISKISCSWPKHCAWHRHDTDVNYALNMTVGGATSSKDIQLRGYLVR